MNTPQLDQEKLRTLQSRFTASGKDIDAFVRDELKQTGRTNADEVADAIIGTMAEIDANDSEIQKARNEGFNRKDWLIRKFRALFKNVKPDFAGELLSRTSRAFRGLPDGETEEAEFVGSEAVELVEEINESIEANVAGQLVQENTGKGE